MIATLHYFEIWYKNTFLQHSADRLLLKSEDNDVIQGGRYTVPLGVLGWIVEFMISISLHMSTTLPNHCHHHQDSLHFSGWLFHYCFLHDLNLHQH